MWSILETLYYKIEFNKVIIGLFDNPAKMIDDELKLEIIRSLITHPNKNLLLEILAIYTKWKICGKYLKYKGKI